MDAISKGPAVYAKAMDLRVQRHSVLASNIANADTPHFKARDFDFQSAMKSAMAGREAGALPMSRTANTHLAGAGSGLDANLQYRSETQSAVDGNTVDMDVERSQISDNAIQYQILTQLVGDYFQGLKSALTSQA